MEIKAKNKEIPNKWTTEKINKAKSWFFEKINKIIHLKLGKSKIK